MTKTEIAKAFSNGEFELTFQYLADNVLWTVVGENYFDCKKAVMNNCEQVSSYFKSVTTNFKMTNMIADNNLVAVCGTAEFIRDDKKANFVSACDVYEFNGNNKLQTITSYCIQEKNRISE
ncbi:hypothetical protein [Chitinophaga sp. XS-30]|uniref:hypothetical protein n=1 Tax=Chitinophaga sp. XS-30 TaxID=2604421 RepID=UPI0011DE2B23|nr:hypothetical protein [Chitinophaga sp. XS-30]QEH39666.1 hypothetical protein FW415_01800 [Chitinophaga sp. XS-30]